MAPSAKFISKLQNQRVLVLGGTSGIGFSVAEAALEHGAHVVISSSNATKVANALGNLRGVSSPLSGASPPSVDGTTCDLANESDLETNLEALLNYATADGTRLLDHVVFTAGDALSPPKLLEVTPAVIHRSFLVRFTAPTILAKLLPRFINQGPSSSLTLTSGSAAQRPTPGWVVIAAGAAGIQGLVRGLAVDLAPIRVNVVSPGAVHTELFANIPEDMLPGFLEACKSMSLTNTMGRAEDVAEAYVYCMKDGFATGSVIGTNGGGLLK